MKTVCIVQARMGSTRLPGKCNMLIKGKPMVWHVLDRARQSSYIDQVALAIPEEENSDPLIEVANDLNIPVYVIPGNSNDLLYRHVKVASYCEADIIIRVPSDNPCVQPKEIDRIIEFYHEDKFDYQLVTNLDRNVNGNGYPGGLGAEVYSRAYLEWLNRNMVSPSFREHPHRWAFERYEVRTLLCPAEFCRPHLKLGVDTLEEFKFINKIHEALKPNFKAINIINYLEGG